MNTFFIRADANQTIGLGHIMRCLSIADAVKNAGGQVIFLVADKFAEDILLKRGYCFICLESNWEKPDEEIDRLEELIEKENIRKILLDSYFVTENYMKRLQEKTKLIYIDDLNRFLYPCDILINYANYYEKFEYPQRYKNTMLLLGMQYVPLHREFCQMPAKEIGPSAKEILFLSGGTDYYGVTEAFLRKAIEKRYDKAYHITIICGKYNPARKEMEQYALKYENISLHYNVSDIWNFMKKADIAVSAGGTTLYELCACGVPTVTYTLADNQLDNVLGFDGQNLMPYVGDIRGSLFECVETMWKEIEKMDEDVDGRKETSMKMQKLVDGCGGERIADKLLR